jgi:hypothetical protein
LPTCPSSAEDTSNDTPKYAGTYKPRAKVGHADRQSEKMLMSSTDITQQLKRMTNFPPFFECTANDSRCVPKTTQAPRAILNFGMSIAFMTLCIGLVLIKHWLFSL